MADPKPTTKKKKKRKKGRKKKKANAYELAAEQNDRNVKDAKQNIINTVNEYINEAGSINEPARFLKPASLIDDNLAPLVKAALYIPGVVSTPGGSKDRPQSVTNEVFGIPYNNIQSFNIKTYGQGVSDAELKIVDTEFFVAEGLLMRFKALNSMAAAYLEIEYGWAHPSEMKDAFDEKCQFTNTVVGLVNDIEYNYMTTHIEMTIKLKVNVEAPSELEKRFSPFTVMGPRPYIILAMREFAELSLEEQFDYLERKITPENIPDQMLGWFVIYSLLKGEPLLGDNGILKTKVLTSQRNDPKATIEEIINNYAKRQRTSFINEALGKYKILNLEGVKNDNKKKKVKDNVEKQNAKKNPGVNTFQSNKSLEEVTKNIDEVRDIIASNKNAFLKQQFSALAAIFGEYPLHPSDILSYTFGMFEDTIKKLSGGTRKYNFLQFNFFDFDNILGKDKVFKGVGEQFKKAVTRKKLTPKQKKERKKFNKERKEYFSFYGINPKDIAVTPQKTWGELLQTLSGKVKIKIASDLTGKSNNELEKSFKDAGGKKGKKQKTLTSGKIKKVKVGTRKKKKAIGQMVIAGDFGYQTNKRGDKKYFEWRPLKSNFFCTTPKSAVANITLMDKIFNLRKQDFSQRGKEGLDKLAGDVKKTIEKDKLKSGKKDKEKIKEKITALRLRYKRYEKNAGAEKIQTALDFLGSRKVVEDNTSLNTFLCFLSPTETSTMFTGDRGENNILQTYSVLPIKNAQTGQFSAHSLITSSGNVTAFQQNELSIKSAEYPDVISFNPTIKIRDAVNAVQLNKFNVTGARNGEQFTSIDKFSDDPKIREQQIKDKRKNNKERLKDANKKEDKQIKEEDKKDKEEQRKAKKEAEGPQDPNKTDDVKELTDALDATAAIKFPAKMPIIFPKSTNLSAEDRTQQAVMMKSAAENFRKQLALTMTNAEVELKILGDAMYDFQVTAAHAVYLKVRNPNGGWSQFTGLYTVVESSHELSAGNYTTTLKLKQKPMTNKERAEMIEVFSDRDDYTVSTPK